ncbi:unnamed protein product, partial [Amoebophrya sp. A120]
DGTEPYDKAYCQVDSEVTIQGRKNRDLCLHESLDRTDGELDCCVDMYKIATMGYHQPEQWWKGKEQLPYKEQCADGYFNLFDWTQKLTRRNCVHDGSNDAEFTTANAQAAVCCVPLGHTFTDECELSDWRMPRKECGYEQDWDYFGGDLHENTAYYTITGAECKTLCELKPDCTAYTWVHDIDDTCRLKQLRGVSGTIDPVQAVKDPFDLNWETGQRVHRDVGGQCAEQWPFAYRDYQVVTKPPCSKSCGGGLRYFTREILQHPQSLVDELSTDLSPYRTCGSLLKIEICNIQECPTPTTPTTTP